MNLQKPLAGPMLLSPQQVSTKAKNKILDMQIQNFTSQKASNQKFTDDVSITVQTGQSNVETNEDNIIVSFVNSTSSNQKSRPQHYEQIIRNLKSAQITKRSQSGEGKRLPSQGDSKKSTKQKNILKQNSNASANMKQLSCLQTFINNHKDFEFLTKTLGCIPTSTTSSKPISAQKSAKNTTNLGAQQKNEQSQRKGSSATKNSNGKNVQNIFKSFHDGNQQQSQNNRIVNKNIIPKFNYEPNLIKVPSLTSTNASSSMSNKFLKSLKIFTANYIVQENQKQRQRKPKSQQREKSEPSRPNTHQTNINKGGQVKIGNKNVSCAVANNQANSRAIKFGQIMEELEKYSLSKQQEFEIVKNQDEETKSESRLNSQRSSHATSFCESIQEFTENGNIRATTYKDQIKREIQRHKSEERAKSEFFSKEFLDKRYINSRVEMELNDFKLEIQKKFEQSSLKDYKFIRTQPQHKVQDYILQEKQYFSLEEPTIISCCKESSIAQNIPNAVYRSSQKPKSKKNLDISTENMQKDIDILKTYDFRQQQSNKNQENKNNSNIYFNQSIKSPSMIQDSIKNMSVQNQQQVNAIFQSYLKQSFESNNKKIKKSFKEGINEKLVQNQLQQQQALSQQETDFNSFSKFTLDHPMVTSSFIGVKIGQNKSTTNQQQSTGKKHKVKLSSQSKIKLDKNENNRYVSEKQTPKNYSQQLNLVVKKILVDQKQKYENEYAHILSGGLIGHGGLDPQFEQAFMTAANDKSSAIVKSDNIHLYHTKDNRKNNTQHSNQLYKNEDYYHQQSERSGSSPIVNKVSRLEQRSVSNNGSQKSTLINKTRRTKSKISPDKSHDVLLHQRDGQSSQIKTVKPIMSINEMNSVLSGYNSNMSSNRFQKIPLSSKFKNGKNSTSQSRQPSTNGRSTVTKSSKKSIKVTSSLKTRPQECQDQAKLNGNEESRMLLKSQIKRQPEIASQKAVKNLQKKSQSIKQHSLMQRSFHHQGPNHNQQTSHQDMLVMNSNNNFNQNNNIIQQVKTSTTASPNMTSARSRLTKSKQSKGPTTNQSSTRSGIISFGQPQSNNCSNTNLRHSNVVSPTLITSGNRSCLGSRERVLVQANMQ